MTYTVRLLDLINIVNERNRSSTCPAETRLGWNDLLKYLLTEAGVFAGYGFLSQSMLTGYARYQMIEESRGEFYIDSRLQEENNHGRAP